MTLARTRSSRRRRRDTPPPGQVLRRGGLAAVALVLVLYLATQAINGVPGRDYATVFVSAPEVGNLIAHDQVRIAGVRVGQVLRREVASDGRPRVELQLEPGVRVPADSTVRIRAQGLLGSRYVELVPGRSTVPAADRAVLRAGPNAYTSGLPEALETLDEPTLRGLGQTIDETGRGLLGNGRSINTALRIAGPATPRWLELADTVLEREGALRRLAPALRSAVGPLDENRAELRQLMDVVPEALDPFVDERGAVRATLERAPATATSLSTGLAAGRTLLHSVDRLTAAANRTLPSAPAGLRAATRLLRDGRAPLAGARPLVREAEEIVPGVLRLSSAASPLLTPVRHLVDTLRPMLAQVVPKGCDITNFGASFRSMTGFDQPGSDGDSGPPMGFRAVAITTLSPAELGLKDTTGLFLRDHYSPPCRWLSKPYLTGALPTGGR